MEVKIYQNCRQKVEVQAEFRPKKRALSLQTLWKVRFYNSSQELPEPHPRQASRL